MPIAVGDVVRFYSSTAGHLKYYICIKEVIDPNAAVFLFLNSKSGWRGDFVLPLGAIPCIPSSSTVESIVSFSDLVRVNSRQLTLFKASVLGTLPPAAARSLETHAQTVPTLNAQDRKLVLAGLAQIV